MIVVFSKADGCRILARVVAVVGEVHVVNDNRAVTVTPEADDVDVLRVERLSLRIARSVLRSIEVHDNLLLRTEGRRLAAGTPDAVGSEDVQVSIAVLRPLQLDDQIAISRHIGTIGIFPSHLTPLTGLEGVCALCIGALREERSVDILLAEREESTAHGERCLQFVAHGIQIGGGDFSDSLGESTYQSVLQLHHLRCVRLEASLCGDVLRVSVAIGGVQGERR